MRVTEEVVAQFEEIEESPAVVSTKLGDVQFYSIVEQNQGSTYYLDIQLGSETQGGDPHFRVINPPVLVEDPEGTDHTEEIPGRGPVTYRRDPLGAVAHVIAEAGGRTR